ncbi:MAG TPA: TIM barrel protein [Candidatus Sulfopaludibacter sp.]|jgi:sugar phosphate isomerase/epimerase|nr:TIM barrel protein [Candidatus Sulfopaludibacter sp.]
MTRRELLAAGALCATSSLVWAKTRIDKTSISAITDEIGLTTDESIAFAHQYGMKCVEIRNPPKNEPTGRKEYFQLTEPEIKVDALRFAQEGLKVTFINTGLLKFTWPDTEPARKRTEEAAARERRLAAEKVRWDNRMQDLQKAIRCAQIMGCDKVRVFTGTRTENPAALFPRIAEVVGAMGEVAQKEKVHLLIENEGSQNVATSAELGEVFKSIPNKYIGFNWDPHNAYGRETSYPDGYAALPKDRMLNIQIKGKGVMPASPEKEDWKAIIQALQRDNYKYKIGLETHLFDGTLIAAAHTSMEEIMRIVSEV